MSLIRLVILGSALAFSSSALAHNTNTKELTKRLAPWQPIEIKAGSQDVLVAIPAKSITPEDFDLIINTGVCASVWTKDASASYLAGVKNLHIANQFKATGYTFEDPLQTCKEMGDLQPDAAKALMLSKTHLFSGKFN